MANLYAADLSPYLACGAWRALLPSLPPARQRRALTCCRAADSARIAAAGKLLQYALDQAGIPPDAQLFTENRWGKPSLLGRDTPQFSLSHSGTWVLCAVGGGPLGVDIELPRCTLAMARRFFHPEEFFAAASLPQPEQPSALCRLWVAKEAFLKEEGTGLHRPLSSFCVRLGTEAASLDDCPGLHLYEYRLGAYFVCLCTRESRPDLAVVKLQ